MFAILLFVSVVSGFPTIWVQYSYDGADGKEEQRHDIVVPAHYGQLDVTTRRSRTLHISPDVLKVQSRKHSNHSSKTGPPADSVPSGFFLGRPTVVRPPQNEKSTKLRYAQQYPRLTESTTKKKTPKHTKTNLDQVIDDLKHALDVLKSNRNREKYVEQINSNTTTEHLVEYISDTIESLVKTKDNATRNRQILDISHALDILLNRIARSAEEVVGKTHGGKYHIPTAANKTDLVARILKHVNAIKKETLVEKIRNSGVEMNSGEVEWANLDELSIKLRVLRQQQQNDNENNIDGEVDDETSRPVELTTTRPARQETDEESSEEDTNIVTNLISTFLGGLSTPEGGVDVDAIVGLVGGLSVMREDGTYDFSAITDLLQSFFGGDGMGGGGSDVGSFLGGLVGAVLQGSANPPGAKGVGIFTGNLLAAILPGLSGTPPKSGEEGGGKKLDSGSFLAGILSSMLGASSGSSSGGSKKDMPANEDCGSGGSIGFFIKIKNHIIRSIISIVTSILTKASGASSSKSGSSSKH